MSLNCLRSATDCAHSSPCIAELYTTTVVVRTITWSGERLGDGTPTNSELTLAKRPVKELSSRIVSASGGRYQMGDVRVSDITPTYTKPDASSGGYSKQQLAPGLFFTGADRRQKEVRYVLSGDMDGLYTLVDLDQNDPCAWALILRRTTERAA